MQSSDARIIAEEYAISRGILMSQFHSCDLVTSEPPGRAEWVVRFELIISDDVASGPELVLVTVDDESGTATVFESL